MDNVFTDAEVFQIVHQLLLGETVEKVSGDFNSRPVKLRTIFDKVFKQLRSPEFLAKAVSEGDTPPKTSGWTLTHARPYFKFWLRQLKRLEVYNAAIMKRNNVIVVNYNNDKTETILRILVDFNYLEKIEDYRKLISDKKEKSRFLSFPDWLTAKGLAKEFKPSHRVIYGDTVADTLFSTTLL